MLLGALLAGTRVALPLSLPHLTKSIPLGPTCWFSLIFNYLSSSFPLVSSSSTTLTLSSPNPRRAATCFQPVGLSKAIACWARQSVAPYWTQPCLKPLVFKKGSQLCCLVRFGGGKKGNYRKVAGTHHTLESLEVHPPIRTRGIQVHSNKNQHEKLNQNITNC